MPHERKSNLVGGNKYQKTLITAEGRAKSLSGIKTTARGTSRITGYQRPLLGISQRITTTKARDLQAVRRDMDKISHRRTLLGISSGDMKFCGEQPPKRNTLIKYSLLTTEGISLLRRRTQSLRWGRKQHIFPEVPTPN